MNEGSHKEILVPQLGSNHFIYREGVLSDLFKNNNPRPGFTEFSKHMPRIIGKNIMVLFLADCIKVITDIVC